MTSMSRPGVLLVRSRPTAASFSDRDLEEWYLSKHIPDVLTTRGVAKASLHQLTDTSISPNAAADSSEGSQFPFLAVYHLWDLNWLHEEDCGFWELPLVLGPEAGEDAGRSVFEMAEFQTTLWEVFSQPSAAERADQILAPIHEIVMGHLEESELEGFQQAGSHTTIYKRDTSQPGPLRGEQDENMSTTAPVPKYLFWRAVSNDPIQTAVVPADVANAHHYLAL